MPRTGKGEFEVAEIAEKIQQIQGNKSWYIINAERMLYLPFNEEFNDWRFCIEETLRRMFVVKRSFDYHTIVIYPFIRKELELSANLRLTKPTAWFKDDAFLNALYRLEIWLTQLEAHTNHMEYIFSGRKFHDDLLDCYNDDEDCFVSPEGGGVDSVEGEPFMFCKYSSTYTSELEIYLDHCIRTALADMKKLLTPGKHKDGRPLFDMLELRNTHAQLTRYENELERLGREVNSMREIQSSLRAVMEQQYQHCCQDFFDIFVAEGMAKSHKLLNHPSFFEAEISNEYIKEEIGSEEDDDGDEKKDDPMWNLSYFRLSKFKNIKDNKWLLPSARVMAYNCIELLGVKFKTVINVKRNKEQYYSMFQGPLVGERLPCSKFFIEKDIFPYLGCEPDENLFPDAGLPYKNFDEYLEQRFAQTALLRESIAEEQRVENAREELTKENLAAKREAVVQASLIRSNKIIERFINEGGRTLANSEQDVHDNDKDDCVSAADKATPDTQTKSKKEKRIKAVSSISGNDDEEEVAPMSESAAAFLAAQKERNEAFGRKYDRREEYDDNSVGTTELPVFARSRVISAKNNRNVIRASSSSRQAKQQVEKGDDDESSMQEDDTGTMLGGTADGTEDTMMITVVNPTLEELGVTEVQQITLERAFDGFVNEALHAVIGFVDLKSKVEVFTLKLLAVFKTTLQEKSNIENIENFIAEKVIVMLFNIYRKLSAKALDALRKQELQRLQAAGKDISKYIVITDEEAGELEDYQPSVDALIPDSTKLQILTRIAESCCLVGEDIKNVLCAMAFSDNPEVTRMEYHRQQEFTKCLIAVRDDEDKFQALIQTIHSNMFSYDAVVNIVKAQHFLKGLPSGAVKANRVGNNLMDTLLRYNGVREKRIVIARLVDEARRVSNVALIEGVDPYRNNSHMQRIQEVKDSKKEAADKKKSSNKKAKKDDDKSGDDKTAAAQTKSATVPSLTSSSKQEDNSRPEAIMKQSNQGKDIDDKDFVPMNDAMDVVDEDDNNRFVAQQKEGESSAAGAINAASFAARRSVFLGTPSTAAAHSEKSQPNTAGKSLLLASQNLPKISSIIDADPIVVLDINDNNRLTSEARLYMKFVQGEIEFVDPKTNIKVAARLSNRSYFRDTFMIGLQKISNLVRNDPHFTEEDGMEAIQKIIINEMLFDIYVPYSLELDTETPPNGFCFYIAHHQAMMYAKNRDDNNTWPPYTENFVLTNEFDYALTQQLNTLRMFCQERKLMRKQESLARISEMCNHVDEVLKTISNFRDTNKDKDRRITLPRKHWGHSGWLSYLFSGLGEVPIIGCMHNPHDAHKKNHALITNFSPRCLNFNDLNCPEVPALPGFTYREINQMHESCGDSFKYAIVYSPNSMHYFGLELPVDMFNVIKGLILDSFVKQVYEEAVRTEFTDDTLRNITKIDLDNDNKKRRLFSTHEEAVRETAREDADAVKENLKAKRRRLVVPSKFVTKMQRICEQLDAIVEEEPTTSQSSTTGKGKGGTKGKKQSLEDKKKRQQQLFEEMKRYITEQKHFHDEEIKNDDDDLWSVVSDIYENDR